MNDAELDSLLAVDGERWRALPAEDPSLAQALARQLDTGMSDELQSPRRGGRSVGHRRLRYLLPPLAAAAAVLTIAISVHAVTDGGRRVAAPLTSDASAPHPPAGTQLVSYHGITIGVPTDWKIVASPLCSAPVRNTVVVYQGDANACTLIGISATPAPAKPSIVLLPNNGIPAGPSESTGVTSSRSVTVDGAPAIRLTGVLAATYFVQAVPFVELDLPTPGAIVRVSGFAADQTEEILDSIRVTPVDRFGCHGVVASLTPSTNAPADSLIPGTPTSATVCEYLSEQSEDRGYGLIGSRTLTPTELGTVVRLLSAAPPVDPRETGAFRWPAPHNWYVFRFTDGSTRTIDVGGSAATDGQRQIRSDQLNAQSMPGAVGY